VGYILQPKISNNKEAINIIVTIFSILAGFLIAVITFITEPAMKGANDWKELQLKKRNIRNQMTRHKLLFYCYLMTLGLALSIFIIPAEFIQVMIWVERVFLSLSTFVFIASFKLPGSLMDLQMARYEAELKDKRPNALNTTSDKPTKSKES
tara:strand:- start:2311 stop:2766 length:456 start_codon:yes stop_codon:yes gene_type:complete